METLDQQVIFKKRRKLIRKISEDQIPWIDKYCSYIKRN